MENKNPTVSVIIATYNRAKTLGRAIESALDQSYPNIEIIVVDDGSTDETRLVVQSYMSRSRINYIYQENQGCHVHTMNNGIKASVGKYVAILDDDDFWIDKKKIEKQVDFLEKNKDHVLVGGGAIKVDEEEQEIIRYLLLETDAEIRERIFIGNSFVHVAVLYRKDVWEKVGGYDENFDGLEDWDLWLKMGKEGKFHNIQEFFVKYTGHQPGNLGYSEKKYGRFQWFKLNLKLKEKYKNNYIGYKKALLFCWIKYFYSLLPFRRELWPLLFEIRKLFFGWSVYK